MSHVGIMSAKVSRFKRAYTFADTCRGGFWGGGGRETACVRVCASERASGFEVRMKVQEFVDFQRPRNQRENTHLYTRTCEDTLVAPRGFLDPQQL